MADTGSYICKDNFSKSWAKSYTCPVTSTQDKKHYIYVCAPVWYVVVSCSYYILGGSGIVQFQPAYWNGSQWVEYSRQETSGASGATTHYYGHNRDEGNLNASFHNDYPLWRLAYWPSRGNSRWSVTVFTGGWGVCNLNQYYNNSVGKLIRSRGGTGTDRMIYITDSPEDVFNTFFCHTNRKGSYISSSDDSELIWIPYLDN